MQTKGDNNHETNVPLWECFPRDGLKDFAKERSLLLESTDMLKMLQTDKFYILKKIRSIGPFKSRKVDIIQDDPILRINNKSQVVICGRLSKE